jgi:PEGA domain
MRDWKRSRRTVVGAVALALLAVGVSREADAHPRGGGRAFVYGGGFYGGFYGYNPWFGMGWGPYGGWGYPGFYPSGGVDMNAAMIAGLGALELNVKPNRADVWVDGRYMGEARDLDGYPSYLWLPDGAHRVAVHKGGFLVFDEQIDVHRGMKTEIKLKLQPGDSPAPGTKPTVETQKDKEKPKEKDKQKEKNEE